QAEPELKAAEHTYHYPHLLAHRISFTFWAPSKSPRDGLFIDRQPPHPRFLFVFQRRGSVASVVSGRVLRAAEKQKETSGGRLVYKNGKGSICAPQPPRSPALLPLLLRRRGLGRGGHFPAFPAGSWVGLR